MHIWQQHNTITYEGVLSAKSYVFRVELIEEDDGRWSAGVPVLPGCATWGYTREEALHNIHDAVEAYIRDLHNAGEDIPEDATTQVIEEPVVAVTVRVKIIRRLRVSATFRSAVSFELSNTRAFNSLSARAVSASIAILIVGAW